MTHKNLLALIVLVAPRLAAQLTPTLAATVLIALAVLATLSDRR